MTTYCPTDESLAAFVEDKLDAPARREVTAHLADCGDCREQVLLASDFRESESASNVVLHPGRWIATIASLAAAAAIAIVVLKPAFLYGPGMKDLVRAEQGLPTRPSLGRLSVDFPHKKAYSPPRGGPSKDTGVAAIWTIAADTKDPHVRGLAYFLNGDERDVFLEGVAELRKALSTARAEERDAIEIDLASALLGRWASDRDYQESLRLSEAMLQRNPKRLEASWNRAAALQLLQRDEEAVQAWNDYLRLDATSAWAKEARENIALLSTR